jgi:hypothetical protein
MLLLWGSVTILNLQLFHCDLNWLKRDGNFLRPKIGLSYDFLNALMNLKNLKAVKIN